jgi:hypothetical protein
VELMAQWATFHSLCDPEQKEIEADAREQVLRKHIKQFEAMPDANTATAEHVKIWSAWAADNGLKVDKHGLGPGFAKLYKVNHSPHWSRAPLTCLSTCLLHFLISMLWLVVASSIGSRGTGDA